MTKLFDKLKSEINQNIGGDLETFLFWLMKIEPTQVNIGADSKHHNLLEPSKEKLLSLITELEKFTKVVQKSNLARLMK